MAGTWEIRGLFGNEYAMEQAIEELKKHRGFEWQVLDRRNLSVRLGKRDPKTEGIVKRTFEICHGYVESEAKLGEYDKKRQAQKAARLKKQLKKTVKK